MEHYKKRLIKNGIIIPIIVAVIITAAFFAALRLFASEFPFTENPISFAQYEKSEISTAQKIDINGTSISKSEIPEVLSNTIIGNATANGKSMELIYDANDVNALGKLNISDDSKLVGEIGTVYSYCYKSDGDFVRSLKVGDKLELDVNYGKYEYAVTSINVSDDLSLVKKQSTGVGKAFVLYTDNSDDIGISGSYLTVVCEMTNGKAVTE